MKLRKARHAGWRKMAVCAICLAFSAGAQAGPAVPGAGVELAQWAAEPDRRTRLLVQDALVWTGHYEGRLDGAFGARTLQAISDFQRSIGEPATGDLTETQLARLEAARQAAIDAAGFRLVEDLETGIAVGIPTAIFERRGRDDRTVVYGPRPGQPAASLALISFPGDDADLAELYRVLTAPEVVEADAYAVLRDGWFVVSDEKEGTVTYTYVEAAEGALKGFTLGWPDHEMDTFAPIATAMYNSFQPVPGYVLD